MRPTSRGRASLWRVPVAGLALEPLEPRIALATVTAIDVANDQPFARVGEPVASGVPLPESLGLTSVGGLQILDSSGRAIPAQFRVLGRWRGGPDDTSRPIRWLEVNFPADVPARGTARYVLDDAGTGSSSGRIQADASADRISITTGPARFEIDRTVFGLFRTVWLDVNRDGRFTDAERIVVPQSQNGAFVQQGAAEYLGAAVTPTSVVLEEAGPLRAVVRAEGFHGGEAGRLLRYVTRITFHAGQSYAEVHHTIVEGRQSGSGNGDIGSQVATTLARAGLRVGVQLEGPVTAAIRGGQEAVRRAGLAPRQTATLLQEQVVDVNRPLRYQATIGGVEVETGQRATRAWLDLSDGRWGLSVTTRDFHRKSPQRLYAAADGTVQVEFPATDYTIRQAMGLDESVVFWFHSAEEGVPEAERVLEGFGKDRLLALAPGRWMIDSGALGRVPGELPTRWSRADDFLRDSAAASLDFADSGAAFGLMHYLDMPIDRFQVARGVDGRIPAGSPDRIAWGNSYWDPGATLAAQAARTGDARLLERLLFPLARHFSTTDMYDPDDVTSYTSGIGGARGESHRGAWTGEYHYLESLWDHYYLSGDRRVLERGLAAARTYAFHPQFALAADQGGFPTTTRTLSQKFATIQEAWLASGDAALKAALDSQMREFLTRRVTAEGFVVPRTDAGGTYDAEQAFMVTLGIHDTVYDYFILSGDPLARDFVVTVPQRIAQHHRVSQDSASPDFMRFHTNVRVTRNGAGGFSVERTAPRGNSDDFFYLESYIGLGTALARSWQVGGDDASRVAAEQLFDFAVPRLVGGILDKPTAMAGRRLLPGLAILSRDPPRANRPPEFEPVANRTTRAGEPLTFSVRARDPDGHSVTHAFGAAAPEGARIDAATGWFTWTPPVGRGGSFTITVQATDGSGPSASVSVSFVVTVVSDADVRPDRVVLGAVADSFIDGRFGTDPAANHGAVDTLIAFSEGFSGGRIRPLLRFDLAGVASTRPVRRAVLRLARLGIEGEAAALPVSVRSLSRDWEEGGASWGFASRGVPWTNAGGDLHPGGVEAVLPATADERGSIGIDVTPLVAAWMSGSVPNRGLVLDVGVADRGQSFASREHADMDRRPALVIDLAADVPGGSPPTDLLLSNASLPENAGADRAVGLLRAVDPDVGDTHGFSLVAGFGDNGLFRVDGAVLRATRSFDFETRSSYSVRVRVADRQGATFEKTFTITVTDVTTAPVVTEVRVPAAGGYRAGERLVWQIACSQDVVVTGRPVVPVRVGGRAVAATYVGGSGTSRLTFAATISAADHAAVVQTGGAIVYPGGAMIMGEARLVGALPRGGGVVPGVSIDTVAPRTVGTVRTPPARTYSVGEFLDFTVRFSERVRVAGVPQLAVQLAPGAAGSRTADYVGGSGGTDLRFRYVVRAGDPASATRGIIVAGLLRGGRIGDAVGNPADRRLTLPDSTRIIVDGRGRAVSRSGGPGEATERVRQNGRSRAFSLLAASRGATTP